MKGLTKVLFCMEYCNSFILYRYQIVVHFYLDIKMLQKLYSTISLNYYITIIFIPNVIVYFIQNLLLFSLNIFFNHTLFIPLFISMKYFYINY